MTRIRPTVEQLSQLESLAAEGFAELGRQLKLPTKQNFSNAEGVYLRMHELLNTIVQKTGTDSYRHLTKGGRRASPIERYIVQTVLMYDPRAGMEHHTYPLDINSDPSDGMGGLRAYIDIEDTKGRKGPGSATGVVFRRLQQVATIKRDAGDFDSIHRTLFYARDHYSRQPIKQL